MSDSNSDFSALPAGQGVIASPCIKVCVIDPATGWCSGCLRSLDEIASWAGMDEGAKHAVMDRIAQRQERTKPVWKIKY